MNLFHGTNFFTALIFSRVTLENGFLKVAVIFLKFSAKQKFWKMCCMELSDSPRNDMPHLNICHAFNNGIVSLFS